MDPKIWLATTLVSVLAGSCATREIRPVNIYPEDMCSQCKMAISDERFAAEIVTRQNEVFKFDDIGCMDRFLGGIPDSILAAVFYKEFDTRVWLKAEEATIVSSGVRTPMGSGKVAFADPVRAREFERQHPSPEIEE